MKATFVIRSAQPSERQALEALQWRASLANEEDRQALLAHPDAIALPEGQIANGDVDVVENAGRIIGFSALLIDGEAAELEGLFVEPDHWRRGAGRALIEHCARKAARAGASRIDVVGNAAAAAFYEAVGFVKTGDASTRFGSALRMRRLLA